MKDANTSLEAFAESGGRKSANSSTSTAFGKLDLHKATYIEEKRGERRETLL